MCIYVHVLPKCSNHYKGQCKETKVWKAYFSGNKRMNTATIHFITHEFRHH